MDGTIKTLITDKGYGFIRTFSGEDVFFHRSVVVGTDFDQLTKGQQVTFDIKDGGGKGPRAENVRVV